MREYDENHAYEEVREDFIKEYKAQLERIPFYFCSHKKGIA